MSLWFALTRQKFSSLFETLIKVQLARERKEREREREKGERERGERSYRKGHIDEWGAKTEVQMLLNFLMSYVEGRKGGEIFFVILVVDFKEKAERIN